MHDVSIDIATNYRIPRRERETERERQQLETDWKGLDSLDDLRFKLLRWHRRNSTRENSCFHSPPSLVKLDFDTRHDLQRGESQRHDVQ